VESTLKLSDGGSIAVKATGAGRPVIFVHGWAMRGDLFEIQRAALESQFLVVTFDLRGHGASHGGQAPTIERLAADLKELFELLDLRDAVCVGWSMGAMAAWKALTAPSFAKRVAGLVSIDMSPRITNDSGWSLGLADGRRPEAALRAAEFMRRDWRATTERFVPRIFAPENIERCQSLIAAIAEDACKLDGGVMADLWESMAVQDFRKAIRLLTTPMLVVHGARSQLYPVETGRFIQREAPNATLSIFDNAGHAPHLEEPARFSATVSDFINSLEPSLTTHQPAQRSAH